MHDSFVHLHLHTEYSMLDGAAKISPLLKEVERHEMPAVAMTDHGNMFGSFEMWSKAKETGVRPILGIEAYVAPESRHVKKQVFWGASAQRDTDLAGEGKDVAGGGRFTHMTMLARDATGLRNLFKLSSVASMEGFYGKPRMDEELIAQNPAGIIATTGCPSGEVQTRLRLGQFEKAMEAAAKYRDIFGAENYFVELMDHGLSIERSVREGLLTISRELGLRPVATNDSHYVTEDQADAHDVLLCIGTGKNREDTNRLKFAGTGYYVKPAAEMRAYWDAEVPGACDSTLLIAEMVAPGCYDEVFDFTDRMPQFPVPAGQTQASWLRTEVAKGVARRFGDAPGQEVLDRIDLELGLMEQLGFSAYFLIVGDICRYARENGIRVGPGRGSATGSMVAYVLGITDLDPIEHQLLFERFLNPERVSPPDIDLDFDERRRGDIIRYVTAKYGEPSVAQVLTFGTIKAKAAIKDSSRVLGYPFAMGERITKALPPAVMGKDIPLYGIFDDKHERYGEAAEIRDMYTSDTEVRKIIDTARGIEGLTRGSGVHACAVIIGSQPLIDIIPVHKRDTDGAIITGFPYPDCEAMGLLKMDFLGLRNLTVIDDAVRNVKSNRGIEIDLDAMPLADDKTFDLLARGDTLGVFQLDGGPMRNLLRLMAPTKFGDIAAVLALYRPGPMAANAHIDYADRKNNRKVVAPIHPDLAEALEPILGETYGLVVYQEQVMSIARTLAGYSLGGADLLRRAMGKKKKEILDKEYERFSDGMAANGYSAAATKAVWDVLVPFSGYGFNKSHTAGYGIVSFWTAYLKANFPPEYMAALLTSVGDDKDKSALYLSECRRMGIKVLPPDVNASNAIFTSVGTDIRFGLAAIRNVGTAVVEAIVAARSTEGNFTSFSDFLRKVPAQVCNKRVIESLIKAGAFDSLGSPRRGMLMIHEQAIDAVIGAKREAERGQDSLFDDDIDNAVIFDVPVPDGEWDKSTLLGFEREMLGLYVSDHPLRGLEHVLAAESDCSVMQLLAAAEEPERQGRGERGERDSQVVTLGGILSGVQRKVTRQGSPWAAATLEDLEGAIEVMFFPATYQACMHLVAEDAIVAVKGRLDRREDAAKLIAMEVRPVELPAEGDGPFLVSMLESRCVPDIVDRLREVLRTHPGAIEVHLRLLSGARAKVLKLDDKLRVRPTPSLVADLKQLLGPTCVG